ncbi:MAG: hypothetical protein HZB81_04665 [Deltaproteobacteria bacterium]|nr:hypothetical protein [Deltaproteobacteria bacterium]
MKINPFVIPEVFIGNMVLKYRYISPIKAFGDDSNGFSGQTKMVIKENIREVLEQEFMKFRAMFLPKVSEKEQKEIEKLYSKPASKTAKTIEIEV